MYFYYEDKGSSLRAAYQPRLEARPHIHDHLELVCVVKGSSKVALDFDKFMLQQGDLFLTFPNQVHEYYDDHIEKCMVFIFSPQLCPEFRGIFKNKIPANPIVSAAPQNDKIIQILTSIIEVVQQDLPYKDALIRGYFLTVLSLLFAKLTFVTQNPTDVFTIKKVLDYCTEHYHSNISLEHLATNLHMNKYYLSHLINEKLHMSFREYINMLRIAEAQHLLAKTDMSITDIALQVGFNSPRTFNRAFFQSLQATPREYRKRQEEVLPDIIIDIPTF